WRALARQCRNMEDRSVIEELQLTPKLFVEALDEVVALPPHEVPLVGDDDDAASRLIRLAGDGRVLIGGALRRVDDQHDDVGRLDGTAGEQHADRLHLPAPADASRPPDSCRIDNAELA